MVDHIPISSSVNPILSCEVVTINVKKDRLGWLLRYDIPANSALDVLNPNAIREAHLSFKINVAMVKDRGDGALIQWLASALIPQQQNECAIITLYSVDCTVFRAEVENATILCLRVAKHIKPPGDI